MALTDDLFRDVFERALDAMLISDDNAVYVEANPAACTLFGRDRGSIIGRPTNDFFPDDVDLLSMRRSFREAGSMRGSYPILRPDGSLRDVEFAATASIRPGLHLNILRDVTERKQAETALRRLQEALRDREALFRALIENSNDAVSLTDVEGNTKYMSPSITRLLGHLPADLVGRPATSIVHPDDVLAMTTKMAAHFRDPSSQPTLELRLRHRDGSYRWFAGIGKNLVDDPAVGAIVGTFRDITERRQAEEVRARLAAIVESTEDAILAEDFDGIVTTWNRGAERLFGYSAASIVGRSSSILVPTDGPDDERELLQRVAHGHALEQYETARVRQDGTIVQIALTVSPLRDANGKVIGASQVARDLTERRRTEEALRSAEDQLRQSQKMEAIGNLAGGVAHDFNNLLSVIISYSELVIGDLKPNDPLRADLDEIKRAGLRAADLTRQLLAFSRKQILQPKVMDINDAVGSLEKLLRRLLGEDIELTIIAQPALYRMKADPGQIEQVIMNLVVNARDAMPTGGKLTIETGNAELDADYAAGHMGITPGSHVVLAVTDTGAGMDEATRNRIFEPFFTTKQAGKGTGLGLSTVFGIVKQSGGNIWVYSEPSQGTTFKIYFPRADAVASSDDDVPRPDVESLRGSETVLLAEDDDAVRALARSILARHGYHVLEAQSGGDALLVCEQHSATIDLLLTDVVMPRMSGRQLAERLRVIRPELQVVYMSGYTDNSIVHHGVLDSGIAFVQKPITPETLLRKIRETLDARGGKRR